MNTASITAIAHIYNDFEEKFGIPRQSGLVPEMQSQIVFEKGGRSAAGYRGLLTFVVNLAIFRMYRQAVEPHCAPAPLGR